MRKESEPKRIVEQGYNCIAGQHLAWAQTVRSEERARYTAVLLEKLSPGASVLELGCGAGVPTTQQLAQRFRVTGVDISAQQVALARQHVPEADFIQADMTQLDFTPASFDGVAAFYSIIHVPRDEQPELFQKIASWLRPDGLLVATMGAHPMKAEYDDDFLGTTMHWSSFDSETNQHIVEQAGLRITNARLETEKEFDQPVTFLWVIARKPTQ